MKRMCFIVLAALAIIICVIAFQRFREDREENYDGILIEEKVNGWEDRVYCLEVREESGGVL